MIPTPMDPTIRVEPTRYEVTGLPPDSVDATVWLITVERRGDDRWAICRHGRTWGRSTGWEHEPIPSSRDDDYLNDHRWTLAEAIPLAIELYPTVVINGMRVKDGRLVDAR